MWVVVIGALVLLGVGWWKWQNRDGAISVQDWAEEIADDAREYARGTARQAWEYQKDYWRNDGNGES
jgi:hypothetical protein